MQVANCQSFPLIGLDVEGPKVNWFKVLVFCGDCVCYYMNAVQILHIL